MDYCSVEDAFPQIGPSSTGCADQKASEAARKEERKKAKRCKGPPLTFLDLDPDRPAVQRVPEVPPMNPATGLREHAPVDAPQAEPFQDVSVPYDLTSQRQPNDPGQVARSTFPKVSGQTALPKKASCVPSYFGASGDTEEGFQGGTFGLSKKNYSPSFKNENVIGNDDSYRLYPDFMSAFERVTGTAAAAGKALAPVPNISMEWKPLTPTGSTTAFFDELPPPSGTYPRDTKEVAKEETQTIQRKLDTLFARLDDLESRRGENTQSEILLFVMSGLFVLFGMDVISKQAARIRLM